MGDIRSLHTERLTTSYDPFYGYSNMVAGVVHVLFLEAADAGVRQAAAAGYAASLENLENLGIYWKSCARMRARLHDFHTATQTAISAGRPRFAHIIDPDPTTLQKHTGPQTPQIDPIDANDLMECLDYARMSTTTRRRMQAPVQGQVNSRDTADVEGRTASGGSNNVNPGQTANNTNASYMNNSVTAGVSTASSAVPTEMNGNGYDALQYGLPNYGAYGHAGHGMYPTHHNNGGTQGAGGAGDDSSSGGTGLTPLSRLPSPFFEELVNLLPFPSSRPMTPRHFDAMFEPPMPQVQQVQQVQMTPQGSLQQHPDMAPYHTNKAGGYGGQTGPNVLGFP
ncbi:hypothetical protein Sste5346_009074 [Sporothrix stenoceras]|uniref:Uncharacterized protein n=1 Tax=Sporothrix stenoceras TaxID=5173 RepID=A0ABR3YLQ9_9PEZI